MLEWALPHRSWRRLFPLHLVPIGSVGQFFLSEQAACQSNWLFRHLGKDTNRHIHAGLQERTGHSHNGFSEPIQFYVGIQDPSTNCVKTPNNEYTLLTSLLNLPSVCDRISLLSKTNKTKSWQHLSTLPRMHKLHSIWTMSHTALSIHLITKYRFLRSQK